MYCVNCGVKLADTEKKCPLCNTAVFHPDIKQPEATPLYPPKKMPPKSAGRRGICGAITIIFLIPLVVSYFADVHLNGQINWCGYVAGALLMLYVAVALPVWFDKPNPVIFVPCNFAALAVYLLYINFATKGNWFLSFALPVTAGVGLIVSALVTLLHYLKKGRLYIWGGALILLGAFMLLIEFLLNLTFNLNYIWWSVYPLTCLVLIGGTLIYLAINKAAREVIERKLFF